MQTSSQKDPADKWRLCAFKVWSIIGACIVAVGILYACSLVGDAVAAFVVAVVTTFLLNGLVNWFERKGLARVWGAMISFVILFVVIIGMLLLLIPSVIVQVSDFLAALPGYAQELENIVYDILNSPDLPIPAATIVVWIESLTTMLSDAAGSILKALAGDIFGGLMTLGNVIMVGLIALLVAFWILIDLPTIIRELRDLASQNTRELADLVMNSFSTSFSGWAKSTLICAVATGIISGLIFWLLGVPYATALGALCTAAYLIPYVGAIVAGVVIAVVALTVSPITAVLAVVSYTVVCNILGSVVSPRLMRSSVSLHPAITLIVILIGGALGGAIGMFLAIPVAASLQSIFVGIYERRTGKQLYSETGALFYRKSEKDEGEDEGKVEEEACEKAEQEDGVVVSSAADVAD